jgi:hypothetical protein
MKPTLLVAVLLILAGCDDPNYGGGPNISEGEVTIDDLNYTNETYPVDGHVGDNVTTIVNVTEGGPATVSLDSPNESRTYPSTNISDRGSISWTLKDNGTHDVIVQPRGEVDVTLILNNSET